VVTVGMTGASYTGNCSTGTAGNWVGTASDNSYLRPFLEDEEPEELDSRHWWLRSSEEIFGGHKAEKKPVGILEELRSEIDEWLEGALT